MKRTLSFLMTTFRVATVAVALLSVPTLHAEAQLIAYEGFDYTAGTDLRNANGGVGWTGSWVYKFGFVGRPVTVSSGSLDVMGLAATGNSATVQAVGSEDASYYRQFATPVGFDNTEVYYSFILQKTAQSGSFGGISLANGTNTFPPFNNLFVGGGSTYSLGRTGGRLGQDSNIPIVLDNNVLLVVRAQYKAGNDQFDLYVNPLPDDGLPAVSDATFTGINVPITDKIYLNVRGGWKYDEIRIGHTFGDVVPLAVPEPGAYALLIGTAFFGGSLLLRRRRK